MTDPFAALADPTRRRILEILATGERSSGEIAQLVRAETGISPSAVSQHLGVLRDAGVAVVRVAAQHRLYRTDPAVLGLVVAWLDRVMPGFEHQLDALGTEVARGKRDRRHPAESSGTPAGSGQGGPAASAS